jgi:DnaJ-class molecular chaperone
MEYTDKDPVLGKRLIRVSPCPKCNGAGEDSWHIGCGDSGPDSCSKCDGCGEIAKFKWIDAKTGASYGQWLEIGEG